MLPHVDRNAFILDLDLRGLTYHRISHTIVHNVSFWVDYYQVFLNETMHLIMLNNNVSEHAEMHTVGTYCISASSGECQH